jgi:hypothetical protein
MSANASEISDGAHSAVTRSASFLRNVLRLDALSCVACGVLQVALPTQMAGWLNLPRPLVVYTGEFLLAYAAIVAIVSMRPVIPRLPVQLLVVGNVGWGVACMALAAGPWLQPSAPGMAYLAMQAATVLLMAALQVAGMRRLPAW